MCPRFHKFLLFMGYTPSAAKDVRIGGFCKTLAEFALEYRTTRDKVLQQRQKKENQRERKKTRGKMIVDVSSAMPNPAKSIFVIALIVLWCIKLRLK
jgi:hypothetical protein